MEKAENAGACNVQTFIQFGALPNSIKSTVLVHPVLKWWDVVLLAAAVCTKVGKVLVSRHFVEMTKSRIEGLLAAFPKLMSNGKQHTFVETESVRYVYQPLEKLYMLLITTKASNILEDLETLRLFSRVVPEYCRAMDEKDIIDNSFNLIFAFDEIVALGYRESVNLAQVRTFVEMDSHEEKVYQAVRQTQEREAKIKMKEKAKELHRQRQEANKRGLKSPGFGGMGGGGGGGFNSSMMSEPITAPEPIKSSYSAPSKPSGPSKAMKLGSKNKDVDVFVDQLKSEGETVTRTVKTKSSHTVPAANISTEAVSIRTEEKITLKAGRDGGLQLLEVHGIVMLRVSEESFGKIRIQTENNDTRGIQMQTHPNIDKDLFKMRNQVGLKNPSKPFPLNQDVGVLKWRFQTADDSHMPLSINCWPSDNGSGGCDVNIEYVLEDEQMELKDVSITIPILGGVRAPIVAECDGEFNYDSRKNCLEWSLPLIDSENKSGALEFSVQGCPDDFFPVSVSFMSDKGFCDLKIMEVLSVENEAPVKFSQSTAFFVEKYEIV
ncbi:Coatomer subunit delta [Nymphon striatum]|nr:Coatomer subunit delta [Nymphon striatum]